MKRYKRVNYGHSAQERHKKASDSQPLGGAAHHYFLHRGNNFFSHIWLLFFILSSQTLILW